MTIPLPFFYDIGCLSVESHVIYIIISLIFGKKECMLACDTPTDPILSLEWVGGVGVGRVELLHNIARVGQGGQTQVSDRAFDRTTL